MQQSEATVLIIIDQFEEWLGQAASDQAQEFLTWFGEGMVAAQKLPAPMLIVLATMRSDFLPAFQQSTLQPSVKIFSKLVNPIPVERFGELIEGPANLVGLKLEPGFAYLHSFGTQLHQLRHPLSRRGKNSIDGQVKFIMRSVDRS